MNFSTFDVNCRERTHGAIVFAGTASYAALFVDGDAAVACAFVTYDADGSGRTMA